MGSNSSVPAVYDDAAYGILGMFIALTTVSTAARATSRYLQKASFGVDDGLAYFGWICYTANAISCLSAIPKGAMNLTKLATLTPEGMDSIQNCWLASSVFFNLTMISVKLSMLFLYRRIFTMNERWFSIFWWFNFIYILPCWTATTFGIVIYSNVHELKLGNQTMEYAIPAISASNALSDLMILVLPIRSVFRLNLTKRQKVGIGALFGLGLITTMVSLLRMSMTIYTTIHDLGWNPAYSAYVDIMLAGAETCAAVMCVCLPVTKKFFTMAGEVAFSGVSSLISLVSRGSNDSTTGEQASGRSFRSNSSRGTMAKRNITRERTYDIDSNPLSDYPPSKRSDERV